MAQLALGWAICNKDVSVALLGFSRLSQIDENLQALKVLDIWTQEIEDELEKILDNTPDPGMNCRTWKSNVPRRQLQLHTK